MWSGVGRYHTYGTYIEHIQRIHIHTSYRNERMSSLAMTYTEHTVALLALALALALLYTATAQGQGQGMDSSSTGTVPATRPGTERSTAV